MKGNAGQEEERLLKYYSHNSRSGSAGAKAFRMRLPGVVEGFFKPGDQFLIHFSGGCQLYDRLAHAAGWLHVQPRTLGEGFVIDPYLNASVGCRAHHSKLPFSAKTDISFLGAISYFQSR